LVQHPDLGGGHRTGVVR